MNTVFTSFYTLPSVDISEVLRYSGEKSRNTKTEELIYECINELENDKKYGVCYTVLPVKVSGKTVDFGTFSYKSKDLAKNLENASGAVIFAATLGAFADRIIIKNSSFSPAKAVIFDALFAERTEALCDAFNNEITKQKASEGFVTYPRFSAGYGDFPLKAQKDILALLDAGRKIGLTLNDSLLMSPSKSVTAVIGFGTEKK